MINPDCASSYGETPRKYLTRSPSATSARWMNNAAQGFQGRLVFGASAIDSEAAEPKVSARDESISANSIESLSKSGSSMLTDRTKALTKSTAPSRNHSAPCSPTAAGATPIEVNMCLSSDLSFKSALCRATARFEEVLAAVPGVRCHAKATIRSITHWYHDKRKTQGLSWCR